MMNKKGKENMKECQTKKWIKEYLIGTFGRIIVGVFIGFFAMCLVYLLPVEEMKNNALMAKDMISEISTTYSIFEMKSTMLDNYTDSIMVSTAICPKEASVFEKVVYNYHISYLRGYLEQENLTRYLCGEEGHGYTYYSHYWNGYLLFLKPLLMIFEYNDVLLINFMAQMTLFIWVIAGMVKRNKEWLVVPFVITVLSIGAPSATGLSLQLSDVYYVALFGCGILVWNYERLNHKKIYFLFLILGMMTSFFDFLTYPLFALGIPLIICLACDNQSNVWKSVLRTITNSMGWSVGYIGMWLGKGIIGSLMYPESQALETGIGHFFMRSSKNVSGEMVGFFDVLMENVFVYLNWPMAFVLIVTVMFFFIKMIKGKHLNKRSIMKAIPYLIICVYPFAWYMLMKNHSYIHAFMVYRILGVAVFSGLSFLATITKKEE